LDSAHDFSLFPPVPRDRTVFIAMSLRPEMEARWKTVIAPAVGDVSVGDVSVGSERLEPLRVDARTMSDSVLTEIVRAISRARLVFADLSTFDGVRSANVMYEVGVAHATRLPEEVVLFRDDRDPLLFDVSNITVHQYDPDRDPAAARAKVASTLAAALREIDLRKCLAVQRALEALDLDSHDLLQATSRSEHPAPSLSRGPAAIQRLLELGLLRTRDEKDHADDLGPEASPPELVRYLVTPLGQEVLRAAEQRSSRG
jgi:hypothetical protein